MKKTNDKLTIFGDVSGLLYRSRRNWTVRSGSNEIGFKTSARRVLDGWIDENSMFSSWKRRQLQCRHYDVTLLFFFHVTYKSIRGTQGVQLICIRGLPIVVRHITVVLLFAPMLTVSRRVRFHCRLKSYGFSRADGRCDTVKLIIVINK